MSTKPVFQPFSGQSHRLGSTTPKIVSKAKCIEVENKNKLSTVSLNSLEPITNIHIWLANGKRSVQKFNISHRISHIKDFIEKHQGSQRSPPFSPARARPFLKLLDETLTLDIRSHGSLGTILAATYKMRLKKILTSQDCDDD